MKGKSERGRGGAGGAWGRPGRADPPRAEPGPSRPPGASRPLLPRPGERSVSESRAGQEAAVLLPQGRSLPRPRWVLPGRIAPPAPSMGAGSWGPSGPENGARPPQPSPRVPPPTGAAQRVGETRLLCIGFYSAGEGVCGVTAVRGAAAGGGRPCAGGEATFPGGAAAAGRARWAAPLRSPRRWPRSPSGPRESCPRRGARRGSGFAL